jgi:Flp pilus assembly protein CpaB
VRRMERRPLSRRPRRPRRRRPRPSDLLLAVRRRPQLRWALAAALAAGAALTVHGLAADAEQARHRWGSAVAVLVATRDLDAGAVIGAGDVEAREVPAALAPPQPATEPAGRTLTAAVYAGEALDERRLAPGGLSTTAAVLPAGTRAVAVPADPSTAPPLTEGDSVDVLVAADSIDGPLRPSVAVAGARVVDVGEQAVTVAVPATHAPRVATAAATGLVALALAGA